MKSLTDKLNDLIEGKYKNELWALFELGLHACQTGDCPHEKQSECDAELASIVSPYNQLREILRAVMPLVGECDQVDQGVYALPKSKDRIADILDDLETKLDEMKEGK